MIENLSTANANTKTDPENKQSIHYIRLTDSQIDDWLTKIYGKNSAQIDEMNAAQTDETKKIQRKGKNPSYAYLVTDKILDIATKYCDDNNTENEDKNEDKNEG